MKVIFLDIDGVITSARIGWFTYDMYAVNYINWLCEQINAKVVISSTWRKSYEKEFFAEHFKYLHDDWRTKVLPRIKMSESVPRGAEIKEWMDRHPDVDDYLILDDDSDMLDSQKDRFVKTDTYNGLMFEHIIKIRDIFSKEMKAQFHSGINPNVREPKDYE
jgi:hypothetical protein